MRSSGFQTLWLATTWMLLGACSGIELSPVNPTGLDFSGRWQLDAQVSDVVPDLRNHLPNKSRRRMTRQGGGAGFRDLGSGLTFIRHDFQVLSSSKIEIEQNRDSMGIRHVPGTYRDISWGERQRGLWEVYAGWEGKELVVFSKAKDLRVQERYRLASADRLEVTVLIAADGEDFNFRRVFDRR